MPSEIEPPEGCGHHAYVDYLRTIGVTIYSQLNVHQSMRLSRERDRDFPVRRRGDQPQTRNPVKDEPNQ